MNQKGFRLQIEYHYVCFSNVSPIHLRLKNKIFAQTQQNIRINPNKVTQKCHFAMNIIKR